MQGGCQAARITPSRTIGTGSLGAGTWELSLGRACVAPTPARCRKPKGGRPQKRDRNKDQGEEGEHNPRDEQGPDKNRTLGHKIRITDQLDWQAKGRYWVSGGRNQVLLREVQNALIRLKAWTKGGSDWLHDHTHTTHAWDKWVRRTTTVGQAGKLWQRMIWNLVKAPPEGEEMGRGRDRVMITASGPTDGMKQDEYRALVIAAVRVTEREDPEDLMLQIVMMENRVRSAQQAKMARTRSAQSPE